MNKSENNTTEDRQGMTQGGEEKISNSGHHLKEETSSNRSVKKKEQNPTSYNIRYVNEGMIKTWATWKTIKENYQKLYDNIWPKGNRNNLERHNLKLLTKCVNIY